MELANSGESGVSKPASVTLEKEQAGIGEALILGPFSHLRLYDSEIQRYCQSALEIETIAGAIKKGQTQLPSSLC